MDKDKKSIIIYFENINKFLKSTIIFLRYIQVQKPIQSKKWYILQKEYIFFEIFFGE
jgi:hypothetical protein